MPAARNDDFENLLGYLKATRGFDFTGYKRQTLTRRVEKRMATVGSASYVDYLDHLEVHPEEFAQLFDTILINVTSFCRDKAAWDYLASEIVPQVVGDKSDRTPIRVWSAGCASGEEAYSIAMVLAEAVGTERFQQRVKIYATDVDDAALTTARHGTYSVQDLEPLPEEWRGRYFERVGDAMAFRSEFRRSIIFGRHDLISDAPISRLNLLICRNTLMYFNVDAQDVILQHLHFALAPDGYLFLGKAEMLLSHGELFTAVNIKHRVFARVGIPAFRQRGVDRGMIPYEQTGAAESRLVEHALESGPVATVLVDAAGFVVAASEQARRLFDLLERDIGKPLQDLEMSYRPVELRSRIDEAYLTGNTVTVEEAEMQAPGGQSQFFGVQVTPLNDPEGTPLGVAISFADVTALRGLRVDLEHSKQDLETAYEELQSTNEELETTNEELQSTVEELETTNEELQSTNEELETMNEELQSTNSELQAINDEMQRRTDEINDVNELAESILQTANIGVITVDDALRVTRWSRVSEELWGVRADEARARPFEDLDLGLPMKDVNELLRECLETGQRAEATLDATNRRGQSITIRCVCVPLPRSPNEKAGVVLLMDER